MADQSSLIQCKNSSKPVPSYISCAQDDIERGHPSFASILEQAESISCTLSRLNSTIRCRTGEWTPQMNNRGGVEGLGSFVALRTLFRSWKRDQDVIARCSTGNVVRTFLHSKFEGFPYSGKKRSYNRQTGILIFPTKFPEHTGELQYFQEFGSSFLGFSSEVSLISGGRYSLSLVTIVSKVNH